MDGNKICCTISALLKEKRIPKMQFYKDCNIKQQSFSAWQSGKYFPSAESLRSIAEYLGVSVGTLWDGIEEDKKEKPSGEIPEGREDVKKLFAILAELSEDDLSKVADYAELLALRHKK